MVMRPKLIALLAVSAMALVGCASAQPSSEPTETVTVTAEPSPTARASKAAEQKSSISESASYDPGNLEDVAAQSFFMIARSLAPMAGDHSKLDRDKYAEALHDYCVEGKDFTISSVKKLNEQLADNATQKFCPMIEQELNSR